MPGILPDSFRDGETLPFHVERVLRFSGPCQSLSGAEWTHDFFFRYGGENRRFDLRYLRQFVHTPSSLFRNIAADRPWLASCRA